MQCNVSNKLKSNLHFAILYSFVSLHFKSCNKTKNYGLLALLQFEDTSWLFKRKCMRYGAACKKAYICESPAQAEKSAAIRWEGVWWGGAKKILRLRSAQFSPPLQGEPARRLEKTNMKLRVMAERPNRVLPRIGEELLSIKQRRIFKHLSNEVLRATEKIRFKAKIPWRIPWIPVNTLDDASACGT